MIPETLISCLDVDYRDAVAVAAGVWFRGWESDLIEHNAVALIHEVADYAPGEFYRRELPCLLEVLARGPCPDVIIVDGYVWLGEGRPGLGARLHESVGGIIVGVAKTKFASATEAIPVLRGGSRSPLYVTSVGVEAEIAARWVEGMHGEFRAPTMLKSVDRLART